MAQKPKQILTPGQFSPDILEFIRLLQIRNVRYLIVGGQAVIYHGYARFTGDVDFFYANQPENIQALFAALEEFWQRNIPGVEKANELAEPGIIIQFGRPPNRIDLLNQIDGVKFEEAWEDRVTVKIPSQSSEIGAYFIDLKSLLRNKRASSRPKDLDDLHALE
jgi:hypothetical protein